MPRVWEVPVHDSTRVRDARVAAEAAAARAGLDAGRAAGCALVATELATNLLKHAGGGLILLDVVSRPDPDRADGAAPMVQIVAIDHGPGVRDVAGALRDGFSTTSSLGAGLGTCRRVADDFDLHSTVGRGTIALARLGSRPVRRPAPASPVPGVRAGGVNVPFAGAEFSGDAWSWVRAGDLITLMLADGLGHGPAAARASSAAVEQLYRAPELPPAQLLRRLEGALRDTRGAAVAVAQLDLAAGRLLFSGVGNIGARLRTGADWQPLLSRPGIVGAHRAARLPQHEADWGDDRLLVLHSDGLPSRWSPGPAAHSPSLDPAVIAAVIVRDASSPARPVRDDTTVAVLSPSPPDRLP
ncbi:MULTISPECIES: ATP-binding SpoIIE family protein phosphatase [Streptomyces]|uniref:ATP-binding protein/SpoIIE family protein phosphatase n=1 Tax=Streptomyces caniscabiei TaxID=2746961 RepID=A0ABU4MS86_9ACTN|nr:MULTISPECIES: ATP-binding SpoIIE family protein phosphatase [Streptomyces]MBE4737436.1 SpoIIE family protein phosphatase [Streptomyces caniscabiei]MBE4756196.1 SpoIIE family protein phosphatase [Streptomyces caniscabiei]MBE4769787.1 SpoIIE family protein phosphatase [Streptomyces caniscabiei]MBE4787267.1 SpoIIE family protein phosphatase [Streptomyces caniscabiei]MBE4795328.1 SpoIIE family protein phosphatase [Streptomyces caniscabiei]